jgi:hypothetical protein
MVAEKTDAALRTLGRLRILTRKTKPTPICCSDNKLKIMDDKQHVGNPDRSRINVNEDYELNDWSQKFGVSHEELKAAVAAVGTQADDVEAYLTKK